jgi:hypothetical protein
MLRSILSVIAGYAAMAILVMAGFSIAFVRPDLAFRPGTLTVTTGWLVYTILLSFVAALAGGWVCRRIARSGKPVWVLAVFAVHLGLASAVQNFSRPEPALSSEEVTALPALERGQYARQPDWYAFALPVLAGAGILLGGRGRGAKAP